MVALVPARGGSKGLPGKNLRVVAGRPLIAHSVACAQRVPGVGRIVVSTDSPEIAEAARAAGAEVPFLRPAELALDLTPTFPVLAHALGELREQGHEPGVVLLLEPTSPARDPLLVQEALQALADDPDADGVVAVSRPTFNPSYVGVTSDAGVLHRWDERGRGLVRRQDAAPFLRVNGNFYAWRSPFVRQEPASWLDEGRHLAFEIPERLAHSIDEQYELDVLDALLGAGVVSLPWL